MFIKAHFDGFLHLKEVVEANGDTSRSIESFFKAEESQSQGVTAGRLSRLMFLLTLIVEVPIYTIYNPEVASSYIIKSLIGYV